MAELPTGTVTFLFTDVEGSTSLVGRLGDELRRRDGRSTGACFARRSRQAGGHEIDSRGDEFFAVFQRTRDAVEAALKAQRDFAAHEWPANGAVRVRIGIHTGEPLLGESGYEGLDVHRVARICAAGHGGQVLVSQTTRNLLEAGQVLEAEFQDLGEHDLRGLPRPERIFQLIAPDLPVRVSAAAHRERPHRRRGRRRREAKGLRVVLADDSVLLREGIARLLTEAGFDVVGQSGDPEDLMLKVRSYAPDVAIVDIRMPPTQTDEGLRAAQEIRQSAPERRRARALAVRRARLRDGAARRERRGRRATCSRTASRTWTSSPPPCAAWRRAARRSTRRSSRSSSAGGASTIRSTS